MVAPLIPANSLSHGLVDLGSVTELMRFAVPGNMTGLPAISFPAGYSRAGLPVGMQAMGRPWEEHLLFRVARTAERLAERRVPPGYYDLLG
jgi:Asp-tRNA(Asn)/Glu-tRNA(Gln) amidotransferase A subunit family amidase